MAATKEFYIKAVWDDEAGIWYVEDTDVPGLATGAETVEELNEKLKAMIPELLHENGIVGGGEPSVPFELIAARHSSAQRYPV